MTKILNSISDVGDRVIKSVSFTGFAVIVFLESVFYFKHVFRRRREIVKQMYNTIIRTLPIISIVALFTGMILTLQTGISMREYHLETMIGNVVIASLSREMGPFTAAIMVISAVGSTMAAELGTMKVSEEIDALEIMTISPIDYLVMPRLIALTLIMPIATIYIIVLGVVGGAIVAKSHLNLTFDVFYKHIIQSLWFKAVYVGLFKSLIFGIIIAIVCCSHGLRAENGAIGVGKATRDSVVASFLMILIVGYFITELFFSQGL